MPGIGRLAVLFGMVLPGFVAAQDRPADWVKAPSYQDFVAYYPREAVLAGVGGVVKLDCYVEVDGALRDCKVVQETPQALHFGTTAIYVIKTLRMHPALKDGQPVGARVTFSMTFPRPDGHFVAQVRDEQSKLGDARLARMAWAAAPTFAEMLAATPPEATRRRASGQVVLNCALDEDRVSDCRVQQEEPAGLGFGDAALSVSPKFVPLGRADFVGDETGRIALPVQFPYLSYEGETPLIRGAPWIRTPSQDDLRAAYPDAARKAGVTVARVTLACRVAAKGMLADCKAETEEPAGLGIGAATLGLADDFRMSAWKLDGLPTIGGLVRMVIRYDFDAPDAVAKP